MSGNNDWVKKEILPELKDKSQGKITSYYCRRLKTIHENFAHVFVCEIKNENDLIINWSNIVNLVAVYVQSEVESLLQRSNFYIWFFCEDEISQHIQKSIEDDTFSSKKYIVVEKDKKSEQERIGIIEKKVFSYTYPQQKADTRMIQKVVMKNFRTYKGERIFDFTDGKRPARLIVLFAPNGMGKTSFFDGVEWTFTETVDRFGKIGNKSIEGEILKNTETAPGEEASVTIYMESGEWVKRKVSRVNNKTRRDTGKGRVSCSKECSLEPMVGNNRVWTNLMLQHHKIDGFIAAANPQELYREWCGLWDPSGEERKNFEKSYKEVKLRKDGLEQEKKRYEEIKEEFEEINKKRDFVEKLAADIREFNELHCGDELTVPNFSVIGPEEYMRWSNAVDYQIARYREKNDKLTQEMRYADTMLENDVDNYIRRSKQGESFDKRLLEIKKRIGLCQKKKEALVLQADLEKQKTGVEKELEKLYLISNDPIWYQQARRYFEALPKRSLLQNNAEKAKNKLLSLRQEKERLEVASYNKNAVFREQKEYKQLCAHLTETEKLEKERKELEEEITIAEKRIILADGKIAEYSSKQDIFQKKNLKSFADLVERYNSAKLRQEEESCLESIRLILVEEMQKYLKLEEEIRQIDQEILEKENTGNKLRQILEDVRKLIEEQQWKQCPVCHTWFGDSETLIHNTYSIDSAEGEKIKEERKAQKRKLDETKDDIERLIEDYNLQVEVILSEIESAIIREKNLIGNIQKSCEEIRLQFTNRGIAISQIIEKDQGQGIYVVYSKAGIENWYENWSIRLKAEISLLEKQIEEAEAKIASSQEQMRLAEEAFIENEAIILDMESSSQKHFLIMQEQKETIIKYSYDEIQTLVVEKEKKKAVFSNNLEKCNMELKAYQDVSEALQYTLVEEKNILQEDIKNNSEEIELIAKRIKNSVMQSNGEIDLKTMIGGDWKSKVKQRKEQLQDEQNIVERATEILSKLKYNREIENYFRRNQEAAQQLKASEEEKKRLESEVKKAVKEYQSSRNKIEKNLKSFFDGFQINDIYEKLEPHETLKTLSCEFDFNEDDKPELTFKVTGKDKKPYAPEWYFSTAQLNVVAFSVFLGKALQTANVPIQSIFIDDPVGHFDEMNVVCFVDLLRNIVENTNRQLIISTHEERVFGLIQRKLPRGEYPVCYIDFRRDFGI